METTLTDLSIIEVLKILCKTAQVILLMRLHELIQHEPRYNLLNNMLLIFAVLTLFQILDDVTTNDFISFGKVVTDLLAATKAITFTIILAVYAKDLSIKNERTK